MLSYNVFQRFCVLLLSTHGQADQYMDSVAGSVSGTPKKADTTAFLKNLNVYSAVMNIDQKILEQNFTSSQIEILVREKPKAGSTPLPQLQVFINVAVAYALSIYNEQDSFISMARQSHQELSKSFKLKSIRANSRNKLQQPVRAATT